VHVFAGIEIEVGPRRRGAAAAPPHQVPAGDRTAAHQRRDHQLRRQRGAGMGRERARRQADGQHQQIESPGEQFDSDGRARQQPPECGVSHRSPLGRIVGEILAGPDRGAADFIHFAPRLPFSPWTPA